MMSDELVVSEAEGSITVPAATLARIVVRAAERVDGARVRRPRRGVDVSVADGAAEVSLHLAARYGVALPGLAEHVQAEVRDALEAMCGLDVRRVDVRVEELVER
jgi:uncharacterized alkaline shock family protein YloU